MLDDKVLAARAERFARGGFQCLAAENLLQLAEDLERTNTRAARTALSKALRLALQGDDARLLARISQSWGSLESNEQNVRQALELSLAASFLWRRAGDFEAWSTNHYNLGVLLLWMGRFDEAEDLLNDLLRSLEALEELNQPLLAPTLTILGRVEIAKGELDKAEDLLRRARDARDGTNPRGLAATLDALCRLRIDQGDFYRAEGLNREVMRLIREEEPRSRANAVATEAEIQLGLGRASNALDLSRKARALIQQSGAEDPNLDLHSLFIEAEAHRALGHPLLGDASMEALLARLEAYRQAGQGALIAPFVAARRRYVTTWIDDLVSRGRAWRAFDVAEWTRARGLLDWLVVPPVDIRERASPSLRRWDRDLRAELADLGTRLEATEGTDEPAAEKLGFQARHVRLSLMALEAEMRHDAGFLPAKPIGLGEARNLLEKGTLVLYYWLGEKRSVVWALDPDRMEVVADLPARQDLERSARRLRQLFAKGEGADHEARTEMSALAKALLAPVSARLRESRSIAIVPDGALSEVPFAALPRPEEDGQPGEPFVEGVPVTVVHSLSVLAAIRSRAETRRRRQTLTFVGMADPVYGPEDPRFPPGSPADPSGFHIDRPRLAGSGREARSVFEHLPPLVKANSRLYLGLEANRQHVLEGFLDGSRFVHLGAHADLHWNNPDLSALYLSAVDAEGHPVDGALRLQDLERMRLAADLVVLAGCQTGLGDSYLGEGPLALPRGFLFAGAASVVASLWQVDDEATSILVERLWKGVIEEGLPPSLALQRAQRELAHSKKWRHPRYWAGFVLLGDWAS